MDYSKIRADRQRGTLIGQLYMDASPVITVGARMAYQDLGRQVDLQFRELSRAVKVRFQTEDPYANAEEMFADVDRGRLKIYRTTEDQRHPLLGLDQNDRFRAVHDYFGHYLSGRDFSRHGEEAAWVRHSQMFHGPARRAMTTETRGQTSVFIWLNNGRKFPPQKAVLLPAWVSEIPREYAG